jgi:hypothetical protein
MRDVDISKVVKFEDLPETIKRIRQLMPELRITQTNVAQALRKIKDREGFEE